MTNVRILGIKEFVIENVNYEILNDGIILYNDSGRIFINDNHIVTYFQYKRTGNLVIGLKGTKNQFKMLARFIVDLGGRLE